MGELTGYVDAKMQSFSMTYDALSRPLTRIEPDLTTSWTWGNSATGNNIGRLQSVSADSYAESYVYDADVRQTASSLNDATSLTVGVTQSLFVSSAAIRGTISYVGFDGVQRSISADVAAQSRYLERSAGGGFGALRTAGRTLAVGGLGFAAYDIGHGFQSGDGSQVFSGSYNVAALSAALLSGPFGIGMGLAKLGDDVLSQLQPLGPSILDAADATAPGCP